MKCNEYLVANLLLCAVAVLYYRCCQGDEPGGPVMFLPAKVSTELQLKIAYHEKEHIEF